MGSKTRKNELTHGLLVLESQGKIFNPFEWVKEYKLLLETHLIKHGGFTSPKF